MNNSGTPGRKVCETRDSWAPATPFGPIQPKSMPICADQPEQPIWQGSDCFSYVCNQDSQSNTSRCVNNNNAEVSSAAKMGVTCDNVEACRVFDIDPLAKYKYVPFASLLALANTASQRNDGTPTGKVSISHQHTYDLNFDPGTISNGASPQTISEFDPITPDKAMGVKSKRVSELEKSCSDDRTGQERDEENNDIAAERVVSNGILYNKQLLEPITDASVSAVSIQIKVNDNAEKEAVDPNKTPQQKPRRKKHRPKVAKEGKRQTPKNCKANPTGTRKYVRKKGLNDSTSAPAEAAGESINLKTTETSLESCRKPLNSDIGLTGDENSACKSTFDSVSVSQAKDFCQSNSTGQLCEGTEVMTPNPMTPKPAASKQNPTVKRKYVRRKGINTEKFSAPIDTKMFEPTKEFRTALNSGMQEQPRNEHSTCKSTFNLDPESMAKDLFTSTELGKGDAVMTLKPVTPQPNHSKEHRMGKRKYVRKKELNKDSTSTPTEVAGISDDLRKPEPAKKSCRRTLNFDVEGEPRNGNSKSKSSVDLHSKSPEKYSFRRGIQSKSILQLGEGIEVIVKNTQAGFAYDLNHSVNQLTKDYISPEGQNQTADSRKENITKGMVQETAGNWEVNAKQVFLQIDSQSSPRRANDSKCSTCTISIGQRQAWEPKRDNSGLNKQADTSSSNLTGVHYLTLQAYQMPEPHFPNIYRKITEKGHSSTTYSSSSCVTAAKNISLETASTDGDVRADSTASDQEKQKTIEDTLALSPVDRLKRKRSRGPTRVRNLVLLTRMEQCMMQQTYPGSRGPLDGDKQQVGNSQIPQICIEEQVAKMHETLARKKRTKRDTPAGSIHTNCNETQKHQKIIINNHHQFSSNLLGTLTELTWKQMFSVDAITERLKHLDINKESRTNKYQEQKALVLYSRDGTLVPFHGSFDLVKKRHPRPKVQLDEETNRVWKLLMQDIISEGIDGTDEENARRWEEERRVFHGRVDSFIARMHLVQGDRRFTMWKGSVVDSVVGVFLTQNVSDHLSSSAFMSLAANFPLISKNPKPHHGEETASVIEEPVVHELCPDDTILWNEKMSHQPACGQSSMTLHCTEHSEEREVVSSNDSLESSTSVVSSMNEPQCKLMNPWERVPETYHDVISSQNSVDSSIAQVANGTTSSSNSNSEAGDLTNRIKLNSFSGPNSFVKLLQIVGSIMPHGNYNNRNGNMLSGENSKNEHNQFQTTECDNQREKVIDSDDPKDFSGVSGIPPSCFHPCLLSVEAQSHEIREETRSSGISEKPVNDNMTDQIALMPEFASQTNDATKLSVSSPEAPRYGNKLSSNSMQANKKKTAQHQSGLFGDSRFAMKSLAHAQNKYDNSFCKELNDINDATSKPKGRSVKKEKQNDFDWDSLRRHVEANGRKKERPEHTKDSLDWEAIRCADVNKIADTIKERGMNNKLAERIKDFLNRVVRDHGSIDLEWLREVPPDKAKEYLLSFRGLGLKSVECVRLLTLHHVAFPVDTNVGRIAVRLGWVPLQPLPESLQLHLLELYPVLESIQKYLWPRLCKLDQRTLYELHYQMITFGKVFCTKSKPNCNACPMRGECRHFASAFASSRLALPGPEEKAIVSAKENGTDQNPAMMINQLPLPLPQATELSVTKAETAVNNREPIIEEPATPEPECVQVTENDIEDAFWDDPEEIPTIKLNMNGFTQTLQNYMQENLELQEGDLSKALVALTAEAACIPTPKLKNVSNLRTEHQVYELPDLHPLLEGMDKREPDDPGRYLLAIWTPGEMANSIQPPESRCISSQDHGKLCDEKTCFSCNSVRESEFQIVRGTILIPCRTAMRGSFPLNGTYFQVNEVFADHDSSLKPINVPREWIWNLPRRTVYFGTSIPSIFKGLTTEGIQHCFWRGYVCVRGFDHKTRAPRPLMARLHFPASKLKTAGKADAGHK